MVEVGGDSRGPQRRPSGFVLSLKSPPRPPFVKGGLGDLELRDGSEKKFDHLLFNQTAGPAGLLRFLPDRDRMENDASRSWTDDHSPQTSVLDGYSDRQPRL